MPRKGTTGLINSPVALYVTAGGRSADGGESDAVVGHRGGVGEDFLLGGAVDEMGDGLMGIKLGLGQG